MAQLIPDYYKKKLFETNQRTYISHRNITFVEHFRGFHCDIRRILGAIQVLSNVFFWKIDIHPPLRNDNNIEPYTFVTFF